MKATPLLALLLILSFSGALPAQEAAHTNNNNQAGSRTTIDTSHANSNINAFSAIINDDSEIRDAACCKTCKKGKACGDSCISRSKTCHVGPGCACDGYEILL